MVVLCCGGGGGGGGGGSKVLLGLVVVLSLLLSIFSFHYATTSSQHSPPPPPSSLCSSSSSSSSSSTSVSSPQFRFHCQADRKSGGSGGGDFFGVDCHNSFLKSLVESGRNFQSSGEVCEVVFAEPIPGLRLYDIIETDLAPLRESGGLTRERMDQTLLECTDCNQVQILDGVLWVVPPRPTASNFESRSMAMRYLLHSTLEVFQDIPDLELYFFSFDKVSFDHPVPVWGVSRSMKQNNYSLLMPDFSFLSWPETELSSWTHLLRSIPEAASERHTPFESRDPRVHFRGHPRPKTSEIRQYVFNLSLVYPELFDVRAHRWGVDEVEAPEDCCRFRHLFQLQGAKGAYSSRLKYLLLCGSTVLYPEITEEEYWYRGLLRDQENILLIPRKEDILSVTQDLLNDPEKARRIGLNGQTLALTYLNRQAVLCYLRQALRSYATLINYQLSPKPLPTAKRFLDYLLLSSTGK